MPKGSAGSRYVQYQGVAIDVLDETSRMRTGTLKSIDGCVTTAACLARRYARIVFETGGNTGMALAAYGQRAGLETFCVVPDENLALLDSHVFGHESTRLIAVGDPAMVRPTAERLSERYGVPRVPRPTWRHLASRFRGSFVLEQLLRGERWTHFVQTISAAFGPIGIYDALDGHDVQRRRSSASSKRKTARCSPPGGPARLTSGPGPCGRPPPCCRR